MSTVLFVSVGYSHAPIMKAIENFKPELTYFVVSEDQEKTSGTIHLVEGEAYKDSNGNRTPTIPNKLSLKKDQYKIIAVDADNPYDTYEKVSPFVEKHLNYKDTVQIDCTSGTKSMSIGLSYINTEYPKTELSIVTGPRFDSVKVISGMEKVKRFSNNTVYYTRQIRRSKDFIAKQEYHAAYQILDNLTTNLHIDDNEEFDQLYYLSKGFDYWDKFQYKTAANYLRLYKDNEMIKPYNATLQQLIKIENLVQFWSPENNIPTHNGFILVYDLIYNAERKAKANYYDDAVSRLYRALEMYEQFALFTNEPKLNTAELDIQLLPEEIRQKFQFQNKKKITIDLTRSYNLLQKLKHPIGNVWDSYSRKIIDILQVRNSSYFAHGFRPVTKEDYEKMKIIVWEFIYECDKAMGFRSTIYDYKQLPNKFN